MRMQRTDMDEGDGATLSNMPTIQSNATECKLYVSYYMYIAKTDRIYKSYAASMGRRKA